MRLKIDIPEKLDSALSREWGDLSAAAKEALAIESYRTGKISIGFLAEMLGIGVIEAEAWLAKRGVPLNYTMADLEADRADLARLFPEVRP